MTISLCVYKLGIDTYSVARHPQRNPLGLSEKFQYKCVPEKGTPIPDKFFANESDEAAVPKSEAIAEKQLATEAAAVDDVEY